VAMLRAHTRRRGQGRGGTLVGPAASNGSSSLDYDKLITPSRLQELMQVAQGDPWDAEENQFAVIDIASITCTSAEADALLCETEGYGLSARHSQVAGALGVVLGSGGVRSWQPHGGTHCWVDLRGFLEWKDFECETSLFWDLYDSYGVFLAPGGACGCEEPGWFRMHVAAVPEDTLAAGFDRLERCLRAKQALHGNW